MAAPDVPRDEAEAFAQAERTKMRSARLEWSILQVGARREDGSYEPMGDPPPMSWPEAQEWARGAWYLHHAAKRPFREMERVFAPDYWQGRLREHLQRRRFIEAVRAPLRPVVFEDPERDEPPDPEAVRVPPLNVPPQVERALAKLGREDRAAVDHYLAQLHVRESELVMHGMVRSHEDVRDAQPFVPHSRGPRPDVTLERHLHLGSMVAFLVRRGRTRNRYRGKKEPHDSAYDAVAQAAVKETPSPSRPQPVGLSLNTIEHAWATFQYIEEHARNARTWQELFDGWRAWSRRPNGPG